MSVRKENMPFSSDVESKDVKSAIRTMSYGDLKQVIEIESQNYKYPWTRGIFRDCLRVGYSCWVVTVDSAIIGYGIVMLKLPVVFFYFCYHLDSKN